MLFPEFLEIIGRMSDLKFRNVPELASNPLAWKIDQILDEMLPQFGIVKNEVNVVAEDNSESDDDYWIINFQENVSVTPRRKR